MVSKGSHCKSMEKSGTETGSCTYFFLSFFPSSPLSLSDPPGLKAYADDPEEDMTAYCRPPLPEQIRAWMESKSMVVVSGQRWFFVLRGPISGAVVQLC